MIVTFVVKRIGESKTLEALQKFEVCEATLIRIAVVRLK
jgi:hypothetical protein